MRTIKFRGCEWNADNELSPFVYGKLCDVDVIRTINGVDKVVHYKTIGQFTGLTDKNGKEIFEGDILKTIGKNVRVTFGTSSKYPASFLMENERVIMLFENTMASISEIIGNIHENPELLNP